MKTLTLPVLLLFCACTGFAQTYNFRVFNEDNGLPQGYIYHISQDKQGFLYASTGEGLSKYWGTTFRVFRKEDGLAENFVTTHFIDSKNNIWLGHFQEGISRLDHRTQRFSALRFEQLKNVRINSIQEDPSGNIIVGTQGSGVFKISPDLKLEKINAIGQENVNAFFFAEGNDLLLAGNDGLYIYHRQPEDDSYKLTQTIDNLTGSNVTDICPSRDTSLLWVAAAGKGIFSLKRSKTGYYINSAIRSDLQLQQFEFRSVFCDNANNLWVATFGEGMRKIVPADNEGFSYSVLLFTNKNGLANDYVQSVYNDYEGNTWIGTYGSGLIQLVDEKFIFFSTANSGKEEPVHALTFDANHRLWVGGNGTLAIFGDSLGETPVFAAEERVSALHTDGQGMLWIGTPNKGLFGYDPKTKKLISISKKHSLDKLHINFITGNEQQVYIATSEGLYIYTLATGKFTQLETKDGLLHNNIYHVYVDKLGKIWLASHGATLYNYYQGKVNSFTDIPKLKSFNINNITEDRSGKIWFTTDGDGVFAFDGDSFRNYTVADGLATNYCSSIICDNSNNIWVGHKTGISRRKEGAGVFLSYRKKEGILSPEISPNAVCMDRSGNIWFGTSNGLIKYDRDKDRFNTREPSTVIMGMSIDNVYGPLVPDTVLSFKRYSIKFDFIGICLTAPENVKYKYTLEGFETEWNTADARTQSISYPKLEDGNYTFKLLSCNNDGIWNKEPVSFSFSIQRPIWKSPWFFVFTGLVMTGAVILFIRWRTRSLVRLSMRLERMVDEKTWLLKKEKENVEKINTIVEAQNRDITDSIHYAKRIQEAMLPSRQQILEKTNAFILYKPRDIVSGDFYWYAEAGDSLLIAVVDCTGHGVPGAFMSLIGSTLLNSIVADNRETRPAKILSILNDRIIESLHQGDQYSTKDGMEVALCSLDLKNKKLVFGGAGRPLYLVRKKELVEYAGSIYSVGGAQEVHKTAYFEHEVDLQENDTIYLFSDGFADQFGGDRNRKFSTRALKELLVNIAESDPANQEKLLDEAIMMWKKDYMQIDDILVLGIKI